MWLQCNQYFVHHHFWSGLNNQWQSTLYQHGGRLLTSMLIISLMLHDLGLASIKLMALDFCCIVVTDTFNGAYNTQSDARIPRSTMISFEMMSSTTTTIKYWCWLQFLCHKKIIDSPLYVALHQYKICIHVRFVYSPLKIQFHRNIVHHFPGI